jgi:hypothetical protein
MTLFEKIKQLRNTLTDEDFLPEGTIVLQNDSDGKGDYIAQWNHPTVTQPTQEELDGVKNVTTT